MKRKVLSQKFFGKPTLRVARELLGKYLVRRYRGRETARMITEVEAYHGFKDKASHSSRGITPRNEIMFGPAGYWYVYFTYGMYWLLNIVTGKAGYPAAVLIRGVRGINGPARVTKFFKIDKALNGKEARKKSGLWVEDRSVTLRNADIKRSPRIGVSYAGSYWSQKPYRFYIKSRA